MTDLNQIYSTNILEGESKLAKLKRNLVLVSLARLVFFLLFLISPFFLFPDHEVLGVLILITTITLFFISIKIYIQLSTRKKFVRLKIEINEQEKESLKHNYSMFYPGNEFVDPNHINSYDLDLFGKGSLYQFLNRTVTLNGKTFLAKMLQTPILTVPDIELRQKLVKELSDQIEWRQNFSAQGKMHDEDANESVLFEKWSSEDFGLKSMSFIRVLLIILPLIAIASIVFWIVEKNSALFLFSMVLQAFLWIIESKNINIIYNHFGKKVNVLQKYGALLKYIEEFNWSSDEGKALLNQLKENRLPSVEIEKLKKIISSFDQRNNLFMALILNLVFVWDVMHSYRLIKWHQQNRANYHLWGQAIAFIDAVNSLANFSYNHVEYSFPEFSSEKFMLKASQLGHPLIRPSKRINNDFNLNNETGVIIITGANMAGKSTFLRTIGVNMIMGMVGAPVCATRMQFKPVEIFSNMRTSDSLFNDESYFFAELKRIKAILDEIDKGKELLIILDEILKGTNSVDKLAGSKKLVKRLLRQNTNAIIATHDLKLTEIENEYPDKVLNKCFEITIDNNEMEFDYKLRDGVTSIMNATFLMTKMGIID